MIWRDHRGKPLKAMQTLLFGPSLFSRHSAANRARAHPPSRRARANRARANRLSNLCRIVLLACLDPGPSLRTYWRPPLRRNHCRQTWGQRPRVVPPQERVPHGPSYARWFLFSPFFFWPRVLLASTERRPMLVCEGHQGEVSPSMTLAVVLPNVEVQPCFPHHYSGSSLALSARLP